MGIVLLFNTDKILAYKTYNFGESVTFRGDDYYVIENSDENSDYVFLMRKYSFEDAEIAFYGKDDSGNRLVKLDSEYVEFDYSDKCKVDNYGNAIDISECKNSYDTSSIKKILENWKKDLFEEEELKKS